MESIYLFLGVNQFQIEEAIKKIIVKSGVDELSLSKYNCDETLVDEAIEDAETLSFFDNQKVVLINNPTFLTSERVKLEHNLELFLSYIKNPNESTIMIINACGLDLDKRKTITKEVMKHAKTTTFDQLNEESARTYIEHSFKEQGKTIDFIALNELISRTECDALRIHAEIEKILFYLDEGKHVTLEDIKALVAEPLENNIFNLTNYIIEGNIAYAIGSYHKLKKQNEEPLIFSSVLAKNFHLMYMIKQYQKRGYNEHQLRSVLKIHPFQLKKLFQITRKTNEELINKNIERLAQYDVDVKTGRVEKYLGFELFILNQ